ncbi:MAG: class I SAM-dependent methyltransferase [Acidaminococcaceae bacterium]|nr:class I SAM-dependent methyltransferase [Acidaminococcaceae bacterium]
MEKIRFAVTSNKNDNRKLIEQAKAWAQQLQIPYVKRYDNGSLDAMLADHQLDTLLIAGKNGPQLYSPEGMLLYHPGLGKVRWQRVVQRHEKDNFLTAMDIRPGQRVLDCTVGLAADALLASHAVGESGMVVGLEASLPLWFLISQGIMLYKSKLPELLQDLRRIEIIHAEASVYLKTLPENSFDAVYFDPMFRQPVRKSSEMVPLRPLAFHEPLSPETVELALRVAPRIVIKERSVEILQEYGCTEFVGTKYSAVRFGIRKRQ